MNIHLSKGSSLCSAQSIYSNTCKKLDKNQHSEKHKPPPRQNGPFFYVSSDPERILDSNQTVACVRRCTTVIFKTHSTWNWIQKRKSKLNCNDVDTASRKITSLAKVTRLLNCITARMRCLLACD